MLGIILNFEGRRIFKTFLRSYKRSRLKDLCGMRHASVGNKRKQTLTNVRNTTTLGTNHWNHTNVTTMKETG